MKETILKGWTEGWPKIKSTQPLATGEGVLDQDAFNAIEVEEVFEALNLAQTVVGQSVLYRSLTRPLDQLSEIQAKQEAVNEVKQNPELSSKIERVILSAAQDEKNFYLLLFGEFLGSFGTAREDNEIEGYGYLQYIRGVRFLLGLVDQVQDINECKSDYLNQIIKRIRKFSSSRAYSLAAGPVYVSEKGLQTKEERKGSFVPAVIFRPSVFKPLLIAVFFASVWMLAHFFPTDIFKISVESIPVAAIFFVPMLLVYFPVVGGFDRDNCIIPLRNEYRQSEDVADVLDALGALDELITFIRFADDFGGDMVLAELIDDNHHRIELKNARNPVLAKHNEAYVGNDFSLEDDKLVLVTGPNSGGKTAFCKTVTQIQLLTQIGCYVPCKKARMTVADRIFYQVPEISHLDDGEGRFGTELKRTKNIFVTSTAKSLVVLDELSEGTTFEEKLESSTNVLNGFYRKGNSTILITHNHQLVDEFVKKSIGLPKQVEFSEGAPTYKLIEGISRVSHADRVAKKIGFSKEDIDKYLADANK